MRMAESTTTSPVVVIGAGPAGLMAAEQIAQAGFRVEIYDAMPSVGRKFLLAGVGGMNITHAEPTEKFLARYSSAQFFLQPILASFGALSLREWVHGLGIETFVGSSGRVFPTDMKAAPLLRAWLHRLRSLGVTIFPRHRFVGWNTMGELLMDTEVGSVLVQKKITANAIVLALGGASWPRLGSNGAWVSLLQEKNITVKKLLPSNCGFEISWSGKLQAEFAGAQLNAVTLSALDETGQWVSVRGEAIISEYGIEGTSIYALSRLLRNTLYAQGTAQLRIDLLPDTTLEKIQQLINKPRGKNSLSNFLRKQFNLSPIKLALLREVLTKAQMENLTILAESLKSLSLRLTATRPIDEAISCAGGVHVDELTPSLMVKKIPGLFCAGEMLDWEAPTGGYLLTACFATGVAAGQGVVNFLRDAEVSPP